MDSDDSKTAIAADTPETKVEADGPLREAIQECEEAENEFIQVYLKRFSASTLSQLDQSKCLILGSKSNLTRKKSLYRETLLLWTGGFRQISRGQKRPYFRKVLLALVKAGCIFYKTSVDDRHDRVLPVHDMVLLQDRIGRDLQCLTREAAVAKYKNARQDHGEVTEESPTIGDEKNEVFTKNNEEEDPLDFMAPPPLALDRTLHSWSKRQLPMHDEEKEVAVEEEKGITKRRSPQRLHKNTSEKEPVDLLPRPDPAAIYGAHTMCQIGIPMDVMNTGAASPEFKGFGATTKSQKTISGMLSKKRDLSAVHEDSEDASTFPQLLMMESIGSLPPGFLPPPSPGNKRIRNMVTDKDQKTEEPTSTSSEKEEDDKVLVSESKTSAASSTFSQEAGITIAEKTEIYTEGKSGEQAKKSAPVKSVPGPKVKQTKDGVFQGGQDDDEDDEVIILEGLCKKGRASVTPEKANSSVATSKSLKSVAPPVKNEVSKKATHGVPHKMRSDATVRTRRQSSTESAAPAADSRPVPSDRGGKSKPTKHARRPPSNASAAASSRSTNSSSTNRRRSSQRTNRSLDNANSAPAGEFPLITVGMGEEQYKRLVERLYRRLAGVEQRMDIMETTSRSHRQRLNDLEEAEDRRAEETVYQARSLATGVLGHTGQEVGEDIPSTDDDESMERDPFHY